MTFLLVVLVMFAILGKEMWGGKLIDDSGRNPRLNFDTFSNAYSTLFVVVTADGWEWVMFDAMSVETSISYLALPYFTCFFIFLAYVGLPLFVAVIVEVSFCLSCIIFYFADSPRQCASQNFDVEEEAKELS